MFTQCQILGIPTLNIWFHLAQGVHLVNVEIKRVRMYWWYQLQSYNTLWRSSRFLFNHKEKCENWNTTWHESLTYKTSDICEWGEISVWKSMVWQIYGKINSFCLYIGNIINNAAFCSGVSHGFEIWINGRAALVKLWFRLAQKKNCKNSSAMWPWWLYCI